MSDEHAEATTATAAKASTKKQRRKAAQRTQLFTFLGIVVLVVAVAGIVLGYQKWQDSRAQTAPRDLRVTVVTADGEVELAPYSVCSFDDADCAGDASSLVDFPSDGEITLRLPSEIYNHDWNLVQIFDDPAANTENTYTANEMTEITLQGSSELEDEDGNHPRLTVVEIQSLLIDSSGEEEEPVAAVWSISPEDLA